MTVTIGRRELLAAFGGAAVAWPLAARGQQAAVPVVGYLDASSPGATAARVAVFRQSLAEAGYVEGRNVAIAGGAGAPSGGGDRRKHHSCCIRG